MNGLLYGVIVLVGIGVVGVIIGALNLYDELRRPTPHDPLDDELREMLEKEGQA